MLNIDNLFSTQKLLKIYCKIKIEKAIQAAFILGLVFFLSTNSQLNAQNFWKKIGQDIDGYKGGISSGSSISLSANGKRVVIGSPNDDGCNPAEDRCGGFIDEVGSVRVYEYNDRHWTQLGNTIMGSDDDEMLGQSVSISANGERIAISSSGNDSKVYEYNGTNWMTVGKSLPYGDVCLSADGNRIAIMGSAQISVYEYDHSINNWVDISPVSLSNNTLAISISLAANGKRLAFGDIGQSSNSLNGLVSIYEYNGNSWEQVGSHIDGTSNADGEGYSIALSEDGSRVAIGARFSDNNGDNSGHVSIYEYKGGDWEQIGTNIHGESMGDQSGYPVTLSADGKRVAIGAPYNNDNGNNAGHVRVYEFKDSDWVQIATDIDGETAEDRSGSAVSLAADGEYVAIGAPGNNENGFFSGQTRVYQLTAKPTVSNLYLMDARSNQVLFEIQDGQQINLESLVSDFLTAYAVTNNTASSLSAKLTESIHFEISGPINSKVSESYAPFALFGNKGNDFEGKTFVPGTYKITATPFSEKGLQGTQGEPFIVHFTVISDENIPVVNSATLIKADPEDDQNPDEDIRQLNNQELIDLAIEGETLSIRANADMTLTESVRFILKDASGNMLINRVESLLPYALLGDNLAGDYDVFSPSNGAYELTLIPYTEDGGKGQAGKPFVINFTVSNSFIARSKMYIVSDEENISFDEKLAKATLLYPNPLTSNKLHIKFNQNLDSEVIYKVFDIQGKELITGSKEVIGDFMEIQFQNNLLSKNTYLLQVMGKEINPRSIPFIKE